jgi:broad specificity phosphatase PhoE
MIRRLLLVRHGRSSHVHDGRWIDAERARHFENAYDAAGIRDDDAPPDDLVRVAADAGGLASSDLPRAIASIQRLAPGRDAAVSALLRELKFDLPAWAPRLPLRAWDLMHHALWTCRMASGREYPETRRAGDAVDWLTSHAAGCETTVVVTHGGFRRLLARRLARVGWRPDSARRRFHNWSVWTLTNVS